MFWKLATYSYENMNIPDKPHNLARLTSWIMKLLVGPHGKGSAPLTFTSPLIYVRVCVLYVCAGFDSVESQKKSTDQKHREQSQSFGVFRDIWPDTEVFLNRHRTAILRGMHI